MRLKEENLNRPDDVRFHEVRPDVLSRWLYSWAGNHQLGDSVTIHHAGVQGYRYTLVPDPVKKKVFKYTASNVGDPAFLPIMHVRRALLYNFTPEDVGEYVEYKRDGVIYRYELVEIADECGCGGPKNCDGSCQQYEDAMRRLADNS